MQQKSNLNFSVSEEFILLSFCVVAVRAKWNTDAGIWYYTTVQHAIVTNTKNEKADNVPAYGLCECVCVSINSQQQQLNH